MSRKAIFAKKIAKLNKLFICSFWTKTFINPLHFIVTINKRWCANNNKVQKKKYIKDEKDFSSKYKMNKFFCCLLEVTFIFFFNS